MSTQPSPLFLDAVRHHEAGNLGTAERLYRKLVEKEPRNPDAWYLAGYLFIQRRQMTRALAHLDKAVQLRPGYPEAQLNRANVLMELGRPEDAAAGYRAAAQCPQPHPEAFAGLGQALARLGRPAEAAEAFGAALRLAPSHAAANAGLANALRLLGRDAEALPHVLAYAVGAKDVQVLVDLSREAMARNLLPVAHAALQAVTGIRPADADSLALLANLSQMGSRYAEAEATARRALALKADLALAHSVLGRALFRLERTEEAASALKEACRLDPEDAEARHFLSLLTGEADASAQLKYTRDLFDGCAATFDQVLVDQLEYSAPWVLAEELKAAGVLDRPQAIVDLGCGTGLCGTILKPNASRLDGIDLAPGMVEATRKRGLYDEVIEGEITDVLNGRNAEYDLAVAADVLIYIGESSQVFAATRKALRTGGCFAFSVEIEDGSGVTGRSSGRFAHSAAYIRDLAGRFGFAVIAERAFPLRKELGHHIEGRTYVLRAI
ncbi:protein of unknown function [Magnetospirillum sp. XM-1]|uniref:tetratricopeptide repeat protein n=1 Tax=Magnetospirillum sp. XM-1 TaxID=1663591 RepID=UPI00073DF161|nr:tetratricopeptide repeat protein [Magnetospirillum sp. XM-1]CUW40273.1 protein of unknown function [Magnetospirillum sp. XM-1]